MHRPDENGRLIWHALRDIAPDEELCIAYLDLLQGYNIEQRRELIRELLYFDCLCEVCREYLQVERMAPEKQPGDLVLE